MIPYFILLTIPSWLAIIYRRRVNRLSFYFVFLLFILFVGLRYRIGPDWWQYIARHIALRNTDWETLITEREPLSNLLFWISANSGQEVLVSNVVAALLLLIGVFSFARRTPNPWLAIVAATPYLIIAFGMSGIRQAMGVGIVLYVLSRWDKLGLLLQSTGILIAALFHTSALFGGLLVLYQLKWRFSVKVGLSAILAAAAFQFTKSADAPQTVATYQEGLSLYQKRYLENPDAVISAGSIMHIGLILFPAFLGWLYRRRIKAYVTNYELLLLGVFGAVGLLGMNFLSTTAASRLTLYFYFVPMMVYPALTHAFGRRNRQSMTFLVVLLHFTILAVWFLYGNNSFAHLPYRNILFEK